MTIYELNDSTTKTTPVDERLRLARLILTDAAPDEPMDVEEAVAHLGKLIQEGIVSGPPSPWASDDVEQIKQRVLARSASRSG
jgi:hypothetical protein